MHKGMSFTRLAIAAAMGRGNEMVPEVVKGRFGSESLPGRIAAAGGLMSLAHMKAEVEAGATVSGNWAQLLTDAESASAEFFTLVRERSILGRIAGLRTVPLSTRLIGMAAGFTAAWVGEGKAVPISKATFDELTLPPRKVSSLAVVTDEMLNSADPAAETVIRNDLADAVAAAINATFIDPANDGETGIVPASVTYGAPSVAATGDGLADLRLLIDAFPGDLERAVLVGSGASFAALHDPMLLPGLGVRGGQALGIPAFATTAAGSTVALIDPNGIAVGSGTIDIRASRQATIEMLDSDLTGDGLAPTGATAASLVSLWQTGSAALLAEAVTNWETVLPSVAILEGVDQS